MVEIKEEFRIRLEKALNIRGMRPIDLVNATGISESAISQYRKGLTKPKDKRLVLIANALNVNPSWLLGLDVPMQVDKEIIDDNPMMKALVRNAQETGDTSMFNKFYMEHYAYKHLNDETYSLLTLFEKLNEEGQERLLQYANDLVDTNKYIKNDKSELVEEAE